LVLGSGPGGSQGFSEYFSMIFADPA
jgi:hypothetical protein